MPRASKTATKAEETEQAVNSTAETEKPQETANTNATEERFIYIGPTTNTGLVENTIFTRNRETVEKYLEPTIEKLPQVRIAYCGNGEPCGMQTKSKDGRNIIE